MRYIYFFIYSSGPIYFYIYIYLGYTLALHVHLSKMPPTGNETLTTNESITAYTVGYLLHSVKRSKSQNWWEIFKNGID